MRTLKTILAVSALLLALVLLPVALDWRSPLLCTVRLPALAGLVVLSAFALVVEVLVFRSVPRDRTAVRIVAVVGMMAAGLALVAVLGIEGHFRYAKHQVLLADPARLHRLGNHIIVGYRDIREIKRLIGKGAVAGVFLSGGNVRGKTRAQIRSLVDSFQAIRKKRGLSRLWIVTDQEGGIVSRLSPPLTRLPPLSKVVAQHRSKGDLEAAVKRYAGIQGTELASVGVNLNLAPVVDINHGVRNPADRYSRIFRRAISSDPRLVAKVARWYCSTLEQAGVRCTLKHFPGLGRVFEDTHSSTATMDASMEELAATDLIPFRSLMKTSHAFVMLSHATMAAVDPIYPVSASRAVIQGLIRGKWKFVGVLITDNFTMMALYRSRLGIEEATVKALNSGVDLVLLSWDVDQFYPVMNTLLKADREGRLDLAVLKRSRLRLKGTLKSLERGKSEKKTGTVDN